MRCDAMKTDVDLQEYDGRVHFTTDAWTSPNHRAYVAFAVHLEKKGNAMSLPLDVVEVAKVRLPTWQCPRLDAQLMHGQSHTGLELAQAFAKVLDEFGLADKVSVTRKLIPRPDRLD